MPEKKSLTKYRGKRDFQRTPEPSGRENAARETAPVFVVQMHDARRLHYDFRLEAGGVLKSWAIPRGPSLDPKEKRLAVRTEDHPLDYADFEGIIPVGQYGAGPVIVWDNGRYFNLTRKKNRAVSIEEGVENGHISFVLEGKKLRGAFALTRIRKGEKEDWIMVKMADPESGRGNPVEERPESVLSGRTIDEVAGSSDAEISGSNRGVNTGEDRGLGELLEEARRKLRPGSQPEWIRPMLAKPTDKPFSDGNWLFEPKLDGERCLAFRKGDRLTLLSRNRKRLNNNYPELEEALLGQAADDFILDGEVVAFEGEIPSFEKIQPRMQMQSRETALRSGIPVFYYLFDLLYLDGNDLTGLPLRYRKEMLREIISFEDPLRFTMHREGDGEKFLRESCEKGLEGIVAKRADGRYVEGRSGDWLKFKCTNQQEFVIVGYTEPQGSRTGFGALLLGYYEGDRLLYAGKVGTGYDERILETLSRRLEALERKTPTVAEGRSLPGKGVHWVKPELVTEVAFTEWTSEGLLRHPSFKGLRRDKEPKEVTREK